MAVVGVKVLRGVKVHSGCYCRMLACVEGQVVLKLPGVGVSRLLG